MIRKVSLISTLLASSVLLTLPLLILQRTDALSGNQFKAGRIIDNHIFFDGSSMTSSQVQSFMNAKVPVCDNNGDQMYNSTMTRKQYAASQGVSTPFICLKSFEQDTPSRPSESGLCSALSPKTNRSAANIINDVAKACGVSQKVLLVLLQKEQSLVTDDWPWPIQYRSATGYGCPDTASCDSQYYGFFNQVYNAARQFKRYAADPTHYNHRAGFNNSIRFHPNSSCGSSTVFIENQATAGLYNYTPYQPNQAALNNLYGTGNSCSSYGNRNFWRLFNDWFGNPLVNYNKDVRFIGDWDGDGKETPAIRRDTTYLLDNDNDGFADLTVAWGRTTDKLIVGDWDGDGRDELGLRRGNVYYLDYDNNGSPNKIVTYGRSSDGLIIGDWNGDGYDELGVKRGNIYYLDYDNNGKANKKVAWGRITDVAFSGDWDGDGRDELALRRGTTYYLDYDNNGGPNIIVSWGRSSDSLLVGDWDGDGRDELGLKRGTASYLDYDYNGGPNAIVSWGRSSDKIIIGDWNGDNQTDVGLKRGNKYYLDYNQNGSPDEQFIYTY